MSKTTRWFLAGWLVAATCDITYATTYSYLRGGVAPARVLRYVASGALGTAATQGGTGTAAIGLGFHYLNALLFTIFFFALAAKIPALIKSPIVTGVIYGVGIYVVMNYVVVPLSRIGPRPTPATMTWVTGLLVHMFFIGTPIVFAARRAYAQIIPSAASDLLFGPAKADPSSLRSSG